MAKMVLQGAGHRVIESVEYPQAQSLLNNGLAPDLLLIDSPQGGPSDTVQFRQLLKGASKESICLLLGKAEQMLRQEASAIGIQQFLTKPLARGDLEAMADRLVHLVETGSQVEMVSSLAEGTSPNPSGPTSAPALPLVEELGANRFFLAVSPNMLEIYRQIKLLAEVDVNVLILGESGTGKEVIAHLIHKQSRRSRHRFLNVNCAALPADLLESELFGHRQGAFTGAIKDRPGKFEQASRGTLLLDEIGEMSAQMQAKLLHVLQDGEFTRLGGQESTKVDVRILAATNIQMESALKEKTFREDLYYRLSAFTIHVPPLRERREEIPYLIEETIRRTPEEMKNGNECGFPARLVDAALLYKWPGNLRELRNFVTRTIILRNPDAAFGELETKILSTSASAFDNHVSSAQSDQQGMRSIVRDVKDRTEVQMIQDALDASGWNRRHAAQDLNISYRGLLYKIQQHRLAPKAPRTLNEGYRKTYSARGTTI